MEGLENYSRKQRKNIKRYLSGKQPAMKVVIGCLIFMTLLMIFILPFGFADDATREDGAFSMGALCIYVLMIGFLSGLVVKYFKIQKMLNQYFLNYPEWYKPEIINCASNYKPKFGMQCSQNFIYGMMPTGIGQKEHQYRIMEFQYLLYSQLMWVYKYDQRIGMQEDFLRFANYTNSAQGDVIKIYDIYGNVYTAPIRNMDCMQFFETIHRMNPNCRIGYNQGNIEWMNGIKNANGMK